MANLEQFGYVEEQIEVGGGGELPEGEYKVTIIDSQERMSNTGNTYIALDMVVEGGPEDGRHHYENLNVQHDNPKAREVAYKTIKLITLAQGKKGVKNTEELHNTPFKLTRFMNKKGNLSSRYEALDGAASAATAAPAQSNNAQQQKNPWD